MSLETLEIHAFRSSISLPRVAAELLRAVTGLRTVKLGFSNGDLFELESLMGCGQTIETLEISHKDPKRRYSPQKLQQLTSSCPNLTSIGLNLVSLSRTIRAMRPYEPLQVSTSANSEPALHKFTRSLQVLAQLPRLERLCLTHRLRRSRIYNASERRWHYAQVADEIMRVLADNGSPVHVLQFCPTWTYDDDIHNVVFDESGHAWPRYTYKRGVVSLFGDSSAGTRTVAVPVKDDTSD
ncbi:uncharacterized protein EKO05_0008612 [Ascochyta rabiei]|nr:uncharacterized protein EKO05_0008612 [Ascochyta rabiei]UPX18309.1 hypothetical protein EKO05_0008612 [Ascochyta rabiei]